MMIKTKFDPGERLARALARTADSSLVANALLFGKETGPPRPVPARFIEIVASDPALPLGPTYASREVNAFANREVLLKIMNDKAKGLDVAADLRKLYSGGDGSSPEAAPSEPSPRTKVSGHPDSDFTLALLSKAVEESGVTCGLLTFPGDRASCKPSFVSSQELGLASIRTGWFEGDGRSFLRLANKNRILERDETFNVSESRVYILGDVNFLRGLLGIPQAPASSRITEISNDVLGVDHTLRINSLTLNSVLWLVAYASTSRFMITPSLKEASKDLRFDPERDVKLAQTLEAIVQMLISVPERFPYMHPAGVMWTMFLESGRPRSTASVADTVFGCDSASRNPVSGASGLFQFLQSTFAEEISTAGDVGDFSSVSRIRTGSWKRAISVSVRPSKFSDIPVALQIGCALDYAMEWGRLSAANPLLLTPASVGLFRWAIYTPGFLKTARVLKDDQGSSFANFWRGDGGDRATRNIGGSSFTKAVISEVLHLKSFNQSDVRPAHRIFPTRSGKITSSGSAHDYFCTGVGIIFPFAIRAFDGLATPVGCGPLEFEKFAGSLSNAPTTYLSSAAGNGVASDSTISGQFAAISMFASFAEQRRKLTRDFAVRSIRDSAERQSYHAETFLRLDGDSTLQG